MQAFVLSAIILYAIFWIWAYFDAKKAIILDDEIK